MADAPPRLLIAPDASVLARVSGDHIDLLSAATLEAEAEIGIDPMATESDVALVGSPPRLVVVGRHDGLTRIHTVDPRGPAALGETTVRAAMRVAASAGDHLWLTGATGSVVVDVVRKELTMWPLPLRTPVHAAGGFGAARFVVSTAGVLEEWDPLTRAAVRRFRLGRPAAARWVGGGARHVWMVAGNEPDRIEVIPLVNIGQPARVELPEPIARVVAEPTGELLLVIGDSGAVRVVDLSGRQPVVALDGVIAADAGWLGAPATVAVLTRAGAVERVAVPGRVIEGAPRPRPTATAPSTAVAPPPATAARDAVPTAIVASGDANVADRLTAWRERMRAAAPRADATGPTFVTPPAPPGWRDHVAAWARAVASGTGGDRPELEPGLLSEVATRFGLVDELADAVVLLYGAHLCGHEVPVIDLLPVVRRRWDEALGRGLLAGRGVARWRRGRVRLTRPLTEVLDEQPPRLGRLVPSEAVLPVGALAVVAPVPEQVDVDALADELAPQLGPLLVPNPAGQARPERFVIEARARGAAPIIAWPTERAGLPPTAVVVVADDDEAAALRATVIDRRRR